MIGHAHIDPVWLWSWQEGLEEVRATFQSALERMKETPEFKFTASSACFYQWILQVDPAMFAEIKKRVKEGRWEFAGGWWIEPDCNIPGGESFVRQGLYAQRFFLKHFGRKATIGFNPDSFGHAATFPQIFSKQGLKAYVFMRPSPEKEMNYPHNNRGTIFIWQFSDASEVLGVNIPISYNSGDSIKEKILMTLDSSYLPRELKDVLCFYGVGNHGGGPTKQAIQEIKKLSKEKDFPEVVFSTLHEFVDEYLANHPKETLPCVTTDLQHHAVGCYSAYSEVKALNRKCEHKLMQAERFSMVGKMTLDHNYPASALQKSWELLLFNQFHDILAGSSLKEAYEDVRDSLGQVKNTSEEIIEHSLTSLACQIDTSDKGRSIIVFNPLPWPVKRQVVVTSSVRRNLGDIQILDNSGKPMPLQKTPMGNVGGYGYHFLAEVDGLGYSYYRAVGADTVGAELPISHSKSSLENDWWVLELDKNSGWIKRLYDKKNKVEVLKKGAVLVSLVDHSDTWSHGIKSYRTQGRQFSNAEFYIQEVGDVQTTIRVRSHYSKSTIDQYFTFYREIPDIDCELVINWQEAFRTLKLCFETNLLNTKNFAGIPYGYIERKPQKGEEPFQKWVELDGQIESAEKRNLDYGLAILTGSKCGYDAYGNTLRITLLRSPAYAHHDPNPYCEEKASPITDQGIQEVKYSILPHPRDFSEASIPRKAWEMNEPLLVHQEYSHPGKLPKRACFLKVETDNVIVSVWKISEDDPAGFIIRAYETTGKDGKLKITFPYFHQKYEGPIGAFEIKTLKFNKDFTAQEVNLIEKEI